MNHQLIAVLLLIAESRAQHPGCITQSDDQRFDLVDCSNQQFQWILPRARVHASQFELMPSAISSHTRALNLSNNEFVSLSSSSFSSLRHPEILESLDLSNNKLIFIAPAAFKSLTKLKYLNLSGNRLHTVNRSSFLDLDSLEVLNLDANPLSSFPDRTFSSLANLKEISIHSNQLACDCQLADLLKFIKKEKPVSVSDRTVCVFPIALRGEKVATLQAKSMKRSCGRGDFEPDVFELEPSSRSLIVYPGEEQQIACMVSNVGNVSMEWLKNNIPISTTSRLRVSHSSNANIRSLTLTFSPVEWEDEGDWICYVEFREASLRNTIRLVPISVNTERCVQEWKADEKGEIVWPVSKQGTVSAVCPHGPLNAFAYRICKQGKWSAVDSSACAFSSTLTKRLLHALSHMHTLNLLEELINSTSVAYQLSPFETRLVGWVIGNASESNANHLLTAIALALSSRHASTELDGAMLRSRLQSLALNDHTIRLKNLAACELMVLSSSFDEIRMDANETLNAGFISAYAHNQYACHRQENVELLPANGMTSMRIPSHTLDLFPSVSVLNVFWFANTNLFSTAYTLDGKWVALNQVHAIVLKRVHLKPIQPLQKANDLLTENSPAIYFTYFLRIPTEQIRLGVWKGKEWKVADGDECSERRVGPRYVLIACTHSFVISHLCENITFFTVMQKTELIERLTTVKKGIELTWWMYMSSGFLASSMAFVILSNLCCIMRRQLISCKLFHILINVCTNIFILCIIFTVGVNKIFDEFACRTGGALIHFFFLATFYWLMLSLRTIQRKVSKMANRKDQHLIDEGPDQYEFGKVAAHGPIAGLYFLAYGIPLFAVSFSLAIDASSYTSSSHSCFPPSTLQSKVFQFSVLFPFLISLILIVIFYVIGRCQFEDLNRLSESRSLSDIAKAENSSVPLVVDAEARSLETSVIDEDTSAQFQLSSFMTITLLVLGACCAAVAYVRSAVVNAYSIAPIIASILYSLLCCTVAVFIFYVHSAKRFQLLWQKDRACILLGSSVAKQKKCSPTDEGLTTTVDGEVYCVPQQLPKPYNINANAPLFTQRHSTQQRCDKSERVRQYESAEMRKLREKAMKHTAKRYYKRQRQLINKSAAFSNLQGTTIEEESGEVISSGDFFDISESVNEDLTSSSGLDLLHVEMDRLSERHNEMVSLSSNSSHNRHMCYGQI